MIANPYSITTESSLTDNTFITQKPILKLNDYWLFETNYSLMKKSNLIAFSCHPVFGLGLGRHNEFVNNLGNQPEYKADFHNERADPHSTYFGAFSETGLLGGVALIYLIFILFQQSQYLIRIEKQKYPLLTLGLLGTCSFLLMEGISTDMLNFRHLWVILALLDAILYLEKQNIKT